MQNGMSTGKNMKLKHRLIAFLFGVCLFVVPVTFAQEKFNPVIQSIEEVKPGKIKIFVVSDKKFSLFLNGKLVVKEHPPTKRYFIVPVKLGEERLNFQFR
jgi:hypothetical protein